MQARNPHWWRTPQINEPAWTWQDANNTRHHGAWWQDAVIYQLSPWSFQATGDGPGGDLPGVIQRLEYIASLGVDAIWLTPIYPSPMDDLGYDVVELTGVAPEFGTDEDFRRLLGISHRLGLKVILDAVWSHTSSEHPWFKESRQSRDNPRADWYVWADPAPDGGPPNNWRSAFTGDSGWAYCESREQYYFFNFLESQPDLNWHCQAVREAVLKAARYWLDLGIDGLRLDAVNFYAHDPALTDNPPRGEQDAMPEGIPPDNPMTEQCFINSFCREETLEYLAPLRHLVDQYPDTMLLGEVTLCEDSVKTAADYTHGDDRLHLAYHSALLADRPMTAAFMRRSIERVTAAFGAGGTCWIVGNHDYGRLRSRWGGDERDYPERFYHMMAAMLLVLPGAFCLWQGDELGLPETRIPNEIPADQIRDPFGQVLYPDVTGRDGSRTPMPWSSEAPNAGFLRDSAKPWLPIPERHRRRAVDRQHVDPDSLLNRWRQLLQWRRLQPALTAGDSTLLDAPTHVLALLRSYQAQRLLCLFNLSERDVEVDLRAYGRCQHIHRLGYDSALADDHHRVLLSPWSAFLANLAPEAAS